MLAEVDMLVSVQGAHLQSSFVMHPHSAILELAPCHSPRTSFISRYGPMHPQQLYEQILICSTKLKFVGERQTSTECYSLPIRPEQSGSGDQEDDSIVAEILQAVNREVKEDKYLLYVLSWEILVLH
jgi:hypothetical protein